MLKLSILFYCILVLFTSINDVTLNKTKFEYCNVLDIHNKTGRPMVVVLSAVWCEPCHNYHRAVINRFSRKVMNGETDYLLAIVDVDKYPNLAKAILNGDELSVPYTAIYYKSHGLSHKRKLCGYDSKKNLFLEELKIVDELRDK